MKTAYFVQFILNEFILQNENIYIIPLYLENENLNEKEDEKTTKKSIFMTI